MVSDERLRELEDKYEGYKVFDETGDRIGKVDDLFVDEVDSEEYIGVKMGLFGLAGMTLIPMEVARVDEANRSIAVSASKDHVREAPSFRDDDDITGEYESRIRRHFGLEDVTASGDRGYYGRYEGADAGPGAGAGAAGTAAGAGPLGRGDDRESGGGGGESFSGQAQGGTEGRGEDEGYAEGEDVSGEREGRYAGAPMGGIESHDDEQQPGEREGRYSGAAMGGVQDTDLQTYHEGNFASQEDTEPVAEGRSSEESRRASENLGAPVDRTTQSGASSTGADAGDDEEIGRTRVRRRQRP